ncbi:MAG: acyl-CoA dehydrogenase family protein [Proteobacteria bacterium]|nr:acyl-CoA dehydrogenase family protein [Pseudomonadota bacterium]
MAHPATVSAREGFDQWRERLRENAYEADPHLRSLIAFHGREELADELRSYGALVSTELDELAKITNRDENLPRLKRFDGQGNRIESVAFHPDYHALGRHVYATGIMSKYGTPGHELATCSLLYLTAQNGEAGHACPVACTAGLIKILQELDAPPSDWMERLLDPNYDSHFHGAQFLTEVQGGSDVGANGVQARQDEDGQWRLYGEKWFCSVIDAHMFLVTARPEGNGPGTRGLQAFAVPRTHDGQVNGFSVRRLKYKLGTRSMASAEVDFDGAVGLPVGDFRRTVEIVLNTSRLFNAMCSAASIQRAYREANAYARTRIAFGKPILAYPTVARIVACLKVEAYAARSVTFLLARLSDQLRTGQAGPREAAAYRMLVNLNKFWTAHAATTAVRDAIEVLGGNGAIEEFSVLPRLLRDDIVCEAWEGGHNVLCAQVLKDSLKLGTHEATFDLLEELGGQSDEMRRVRKRWSQLLSLDPQLQAVHMRDVAEEIRVLVQTQVLMAEAAHPNADPALQAVISHLRTEAAPGYDRLEDRSLSDRITAILA